MAAKMYENGYYGTVAVSSAVFSKLNSDFFIHGSDEKVKFMCANQAEAEHLEGFGIDTSEIICDWFKIILAPKGKTE